MHRWKFSALAAAALVSVGLTSTSAWALTLGRISMQSALGEPLRAEVELPQITPAEADSLNATVASPAVFRDRGMEYTTTASQIKVQLQRRPDGSAVLSLSSSQVINEPFVDLVLDASWSTGQVVRSYTLLLDPPALRKPAPAPTAPPQASIAAAPSAPPASAKPARAAARPATTLTVQTGDTASRLASAHRPASVSLDQMLVAMLRANPHAFINGNVNRIKAGVVLEMPNQTTAEATSASEARKIVAAQSRDFDQYRRQLASAAPQAAVTAAKRSASGTVATQVEDEKASTAAPDKLTLSKGALQVHQDADERLAKEKQAQSQSERLAELSRNLTELGKISGAATADTPAPTASDTAQQPASETAATAPAGAPTDAPADAPAAAPAAVPTLPAAPVVAAPAPVQPPAEPAPSFIDTLREEPALPLAGAGLLTLLLGYGGWRALQRRRQLGRDSQLPLDSFFDVGAGQRVDTAHSQFGGTAYSHSQLDTGGEVDPLAEADVYLAYGRDLQAEEILKEALRSQPDRIALQQKLADIYAKRLDRKAFATVAQTVFALTQGQGADWQHLAEQGRGLEPDNPLYQLNTPASADEVSPNDGDTPTTQPAAFAPLDSATTAELPDSAADAKPLGVSAELPPGLDFDLDLSDELAEQSAPSPAPLPAAEEIDFAATEPSSQQPASATAQTAVEFPALSTEAPALPDENNADQIAAPVAPVATTPTAPELGLDFKLDSDAAPTPPKAAPKAAAFEALEFDLSGLSLDLGDTPASALSQSSQAAAEDPLATKLALAQEFAAIGDSEGARTLIEEVIAEADGELKDRAQRLLTEIN